MICREKGIECPFADGGPLSATEPIMVEYDDLGILYAALAIGLVAIAVLAGLTLAL